MKTIWFGPWVVFGCTLWYTVMPLDALLCRCRERFWQKYLIRGTTDGQLLISNVIQVRTIFYWECAGGCRLKWSTAYWSIEISWNWSAVFNQGRLSERQCGLIFLFKGKSKSENLVRKEWADVDRKLGLLLILFNIAAQPGSATRRLRPRPTRKSHQYQDG